MDPEGGRRPRDVRIRIASAPRTYNVALRTTLLVESSFLHRLVHPYPSTSRRYLYLIASGRQRWRTTTQRKDLRRRMLHRVERTARAERRWSSTLEGPQGVLTNAGYNTDTAHSVRACPTSESPVPLTRATSPGPRTPTRRPCRSGRYSRESFPGNPRACPRRSDDTSRNPSPCRAAPTSAG